MTTSASGQIYSGFDIRISRSHFNDNGELPRLDWHIDGIMNSVLQDYRSSTEPETNRMKIFPRFVCEIYPDMIKAILIADWAPQHEAIAWNVENYAEANFRSRCEKVLRRAVEGFRDKEHGKVICTDYGSTAEALWIESM